jgi:hypothetical protein
MATWSPIFVYPCTNVYFAYPEVIARHYPRILPTWVFKLYRVFRISCTKFQDVILSVIWSKKCQINIHYTQLSTITSQRAF